MAGNQGPWGGGGGGNDDDRDDRDDRNGRGSRGGRRPGEGGQIPEIEEIVKRGQEQLRVLMGGRGGNRGTGGGGGGGPERPFFTRGTVGLAALAAAGLWVFASFYTVKPEEKSIELFLGKFYAVGEPGLNFAPWPVVTRTVIPVTTERTEDIGTGKGGQADAGLMLTGDENIVDIDFNIVWNVSDPEKFLFTLRDPSATIRATAESAMRAIIAQSQLAPILNRDRGSIATRLQDMIQTSLNTQGAGVNIVRVNFDKADPPKEVIDAFKAVQSAEQERDRLQKEADAYANKVLGQARGDAAQTIEQAEAYRAQVVNAAEGDASRFTAVLDEYVKAPEVTRRRLYIETMQEVLGGVNKVIIDEGGKGEGVVPYLPLNELIRGGAASTGANK